jgi:cytochrome b6-f complex iron-sulfur subunit
MTTRREFLVVLGASTACGMLPACAPPAEGPIAVGNVNELAIDDVRAIEGTSVILGRDAGGVYALTAVCTHAGCDMTVGTSHSVGATGIRCGCHGSQFDLDGNVTNGPASDPLKHWAVQVAEDGAITVDVGNEVTPDTRVAV